MDLKPIPLSTKVKLTLELCSSSGDPAAEVHVVLDDCVLAVAGLSTAALHVRSDKEKLCL